jgi:hypothetical protein
MWRIIVGHILIVIISRIDFCFDFFIRLLSAVKLSCKAKAIILLQMFFEFKGGVMNLPMIFY